MCVHAYVLACCVHIVGIYFGAFLPLWGAYVEGRCARAYVCAVLFYLVQLRVP